MPELIYVLFFAMAFAALIYFYTNATSPISQPKGEAIEVDELDDRVELDPDDLYDVGFWRQSGELHRTGGTGVTRDEAIKEVKTAFRRAGIEFIRFATNDTGEMEVWRAIHHGKGTREGRRLGGASIKRVLWQDEFDEYKAGLDAEEDTPIEIEAKTAAEKAIVKAYFRYVEQSKGTKEPLNVPDDIAENFDADTGEGRAMLEHGDLMVLLIVSQSYLEGSTKLTEDVREQMRATSADWQTAIADDPEIDTILGVHAFGETKPEDVQGAFRNWAEKYVGDEEIQIGMGMFTFRNCDLSKWQV